MKASCQKPIKQKSPGKKKSRPSARKGWKRWAFPLLAMILVPLFAILLLEICLRIVDAGYPAGFFLKRKINGETFFTENEKFGWRFFPSQIARRPFEILLPPSKSPDQYRIFVLGESAAMGDPEPSYGFSRILELLLNASFTEKKFTVVNATMTGINSHGVMEIAKDCAGQKPDFFVVYMGNNEIVGPYGPGTVFSPFSRRLFFIRLRIRMETTKLGQLLSSFKQSISREKGKCKFWGGLNMFIKNKIPADDPRLGSAYNHFRNNLMDICKIARKSGVKIIVCTVASNLGSCPPFASLHSRPWNSDQENEWQEFYNTGVKMEGQGDFAAAILSYTQALNMDQGYAELHFRLAHCLFELGKYDEACQHYVKARDLDALRFRSDSTLNTLVRETAAKSKTGDVFLVDMVDIVKNHSFKGIPGDDLFYDHVHLNFTGNYIFAKSVFEQMRRLLPESPKGTILSEQQCAEYLAYTTWDQRRICDLMLERLERMEMPPFAFQIDHKDRLAKLKEERNKLSLVLMGQGIDASEALYQKALERSPEDWLLHENYAQLLQNTEKALEEAGEWQKVLAFHPHHPERYSTLGQALAKAGKFPEALEACAMAIKHNPNDVIAHNGLGMAYAGLGKGEEAKFHYQKALNIRPEFSDAHHNLALLLSQEGQSAEVIDLYSRMLEINPLDEDAHYNLGLALAKSENWDAAAKHFSELLRLNPANVEAHYNLGYVLSEQGDRDKAIEHYTAALKLNPDYDKAHNNLGSLLAEKGMYQEAASHFFEALRIHPEDQGIHYNIGKVYVLQGEWDKAEEHFALLLKADPGHARGYYQLGLVLERKRKPDKALDCYKKALELEPEFVPVLNQIAWLRSTDPDPGIRNALEAIRMAEHACQLTQNGDPVILDTLAAAYAEAGKFQDALHYADKALEIAVSTKQESLVKDIRKRKELFRKNLPFREDTIGMREREK